MLQQDPSPLLEDEDPEPGVDPEPPWVEPEPEELDSDTGTELEILIVTCLMNVPLFAYSNVSCPVYVPSRALVNEKVELSP